MKKRIMSLFLAVVLVLSAVPAASSADAPEEDAPVIDEAALCDALISADVPEDDTLVIDEAALRDALAYAQAHPELTHTLELPEEDEEEIEAPLTRQPLEDNLVMPGPLMEGCAAKKGETMRLPLVQRLTGKQNQSQVILIFKGEGITGNPVDTLFKNFPLKEGLFEATAGWDTDNASLGVYTAVTCTATLKGNDYEVVDGTASAAHIYVLDHYQPVTSYYYADANGNRLDKLVTTGTELSYVYVKHEPAIATDITDLVFGTSGKLHFEEYNGLIIGYPTVYGWSRLSFRPNFSDLGEFYLDVEICVNPKGHTAEQTVLRTATEFYGGATLSYCPDCCTSQIDRTPDTVQAANEIHDVPLSAWYFDPVKDAIRHGLFTGVSPNRFNPDDTMTRAMLVTVLWRYAGSPAEGANKFSDVPAGQWYTDAVAWAADNHIVDGVGGGRFAPNDTITREQMAAILYRYAGKINEDTSARAELGGFADRAKVSAWANDAIRWCVAEGFIGGSAEGDKLLLVPQGGATRAQVAAILMRFLKKVDPSMKYEPLDTTGAEASGIVTHWADESVVMIEWAFFPDGTLVFGKDGGIIPGASEDSWGKYIDRTKTVKILGGVEMVSTSAFEDYPNLETVLLPDSIHIIGQKAFMNCTSLKNIRWPEAGLKIYPGAFCGCTALEEVVLPEGVYAVSGCFRDCTGLKKIFFPDSLIMEYVYYGSTTGPTIGSLSGCTALEEVHLPAGLTELPHDFFRNCKSLKTVEFPVALSHISENAFDGCESIKTLVLPIQIYSIADLAFCTEEYDQELGYADTSGLTDLYIVNPFFAVKASHHDNDRNPVYCSPFGDPKKVTVHGWSGTFVEELAREKGYNFVPLE